MDLKKKAIKGTAWSAIQTFGGEGLSFVAFIILARLLSPQDIGLFALANIFIAFVTLFVNQGFLQALVQKQDLDSEHLNTAFWWNLLASLLLALVSVFTAGIFADFYQQPPVAGIIRWLAISFLFGALSGVQEAIIQRRLEFKQLALRRLIGGLIGGVVGIGMAVGGLGVWSIVGRQLVDQAVGVAVLWRATGWRPGRVSSWRHLQELFAFGVNVLGIRVINFISQRADVALIGYFLGAGALGYYTVAIRLMEMLQNILLTPSMQVALPVFSKLQRDSASLRNAFFKATQLTSWIAIPSFVAMAAMAPEAVKIFFGERWLPSGQVLQILTQTGILLTVFQFNGPIMMALGKPSWALVIRSVNAVVNVIALVLAVRWGIVAVAAASVIRAYLLAPLPVWALNRLIGVSPRALIRQLLPSVASAALMAALILGFKAAFGARFPDYATLSICAMIGSSVTIGMMRWLAPVAFYEGMEIISSLRPGKKDAQ